jgi:hypothetical protein
MNRLLYWIAGRLPCRIISDNGQPYLERYYLCTVLGVRFYLHRFVGSDPDRGLHDHPWPWAGSVVLSGWYWEETRKGLHKVRWLNWLTGDSFHRVILPLDSWDTFKPCWTLFFHRADYTKPWGFLRPIEGEHPMVWWPHNHPQDGTGTPDAWWDKVPRWLNEPRRASL